MIPFVDLKAQYLSIKDEIDHAVKKCIEDTSFIKGEAVSDFERSFADYLGMDWCTGVANGTDAIEIILAALKIGPGDEVLVPALTWISTAEAVSNVGAEPVFVDVKSGSYTMDYSLIEGKISKNTKAIIPVHLYGCPADMNEIESIAREHGLLIIEDCAQAHGAEYFGKKVGTFGIASAFSFFPSKNLGAFGDAGAIVTNNKEIADLTRKISNHGQLFEKHKHSLIGRNSRLDSIQASVLSVKLRHLDEWNIKRRNIADDYLSRLNKSEFILPLKEPGKKHVFHLFVIRCRNRDKFTAYLDSLKISWGIHYPSALPFTDAYRYKNHLPDDFSCSSAIVNDIISIPIYPELTAEQVDTICDHLNKYNG